MYTQVLSNLREETAEMTGLPDPENMPLASRQLLRRQSEQAAFDPARYLGDLLHGEQDFFYQEAVALEAHWDRHWALWKAAKEGARPAVEQAPVKTEAACEQQAQREKETPTKTAVQTESEQDAALRAEVFARSGGFSQEERDAMSSLPNKRYLLQAGSPEERLLLLGLADLLFAYCYDHRLTQGEPTVLPAWR